MCLFNAFVNHRTAARCVTALTLTHWTRLLARRRQHHHRTLSWRPSFFRWGTDETRNAADTVSPRERLSTRVLKNDEKKNVHTHTHRRARAHSCDCVSLSLGYPFRTSFLPAIRLPPTHRQTWDSALGSCACIADPVTLSSTFMTVRSRSRAALRTLSTHTETLEALLYSAERDCVRHWASLMYVRVGYWKPSAHMEHCTMGKWARR